MKTVVRLLSEKGVTSVGGSRDLKIRYSSIKSS